MKFNRLPIYRKLVNFTNKHFPILMAKMRFRMLFGKKLDLKNPKDLNEKILYLSLFTDTSEWSRLADKYLVREYVKNCGFENHLVKLFGIWNNASQIDWDMLPKQFVLKTNNGCGTNLLVYDKHKLNFNSTKIMLQSWLDSKVSVSTSEFHYQKIKPYLIAEELLVPTIADNKLSHSIIDYKIWCFNGKADCILVCFDRVSDGCKMQLYDCNWNLLKEGLIQQTDIHIPRPKNLSDMINIAEKLSKGFPQVRIDLYNLDGKIYFGEMTFSSFGGNMTYFTHSQLLNMGNKVDLSLAKRIK